MGNVLALCHGPRDIREALATIGKSNVYYRDLLAELADELWARFRAAIDALREGRKLGVVLFYSEKELSELAASVRQLSGKARAVHVLFNNCYTDYAQRNALEFMQLLDLH